MIENVKLLCIYNMQKITLFYKFLKINVINYIFQIVLKFFRIFPLLHFIIIKAVFNSNLILYFTTILHESYYPFTIVSWKISKYIGILY